MHNPEQYYHAELETMPRAALEALQLQRLPDTCPCGRTHRRIARLQGRSDDMIILKGVNIFPIQIEKILLKFRQVITDHHLHYIAEEALGEIGNN